MSGAGVGGVQRVSERIEQGGWRAVAIMRLVPVLPFAPLNIALGLCNLNIWSYAFATFIFMAPVRFAYSVAGEAGWRVLFTGEGGVFVALAGFMALLMIVLLPFLGRTFRA